MATSTEIKDNNNTLIRAKTTAKSITKNNVADQLDAVIDYIDQQIDFTVYKAKLTQSGTGNITETVLKNDTGLTFTYTRNSIGNYTINFSSLISDLSKVDIYLHFCQSTFSVPVYEIDNLGILATILTKYWNGSTFSLTDDIINNSTLYIVINN